MAGPCILGSPIFGGFQALKRTVRLFGEAETAASPSRASAPETSSATGLARAVVAPTNYFPS
eukprot:89378-Alexandrium_andersonii.AAC.1